MPSNSNHISDFSNSLFSDDLKAPKVHDHLCLLYNSEAEWQLFVSIYIRTGLEQGEKCLYIYDTHTARHVRDTLRSDGINVSNYETIGCLDILHGRKVLTQDSNINPDNMLNFLISETKKALDEGYPALRVTLETDWMLSHQPSSKTFLEHLAKLNRDFFPHYPCLLVSQYDRSKFDSTVVKDLLLGYSGIIRNQKIYSNFYYISPDEILNLPQDETDIEHRLRTIEIVDRKEKERQNLERTIQVLLDEAMAIILVMDDNGRFLDANRAGLHFLECKWEDLVNESIWSFISSNFLQSDRNTFFTFLRNSEIEVRVNDKAKTLLVNVVPGMRDNQRIIYCVGQDITQRKLAKAQLEDLYQKEKHQREELQEEARARGMFIDVLAHELRTPLTPILASTGMLEDILSGEDTLQKKLVDNIYQGTTTLNRRLEDLLDLARYSRGTFKLKKQPTGMKRFIEDAVSHYRPALDQRCQQLILELPDELPELEVDPYRLDQVIVNLLSNASKFSPECQSIRLKACVENGRLLISITDHGLGISVEDQSRLFQPYHRVEQDRQQFPGIGLGLAVAKQIVESHGGQIWVSSRTGEGSTFNFTIPLS